MKGQLQGVYEFTLMESVSCPPPTEMNAASLAVWKSFHQPVILLVIM